jgi:hypothetical protein
VTDCSLFIGLCPILYYDIKDTYGSHISSVWSCKFLSCITLQLLIFFLLFIQFTCLAALCSMYPYAINLFTISINISIHLLTCMLTASYCSAPDWASCLTARCMESVTYSCPVLLLLGLHGWQKHIRLLFLDFRMLSFSSTPLVESLLAVFCLMN